MIYPHAGVIAAMAGALMLCMAVAWLVQRSTGNAGWVDVFWTAGLGSVASVAALFPLDGWSTPSTRQWVLAALMAVWALRLGTHLAVRSFSKPDDPRYAHLVAEWGPRAPLLMFLMLQVQALAALILAVAVMAAAHNPQPLGGIQDVLAGLLMLAAIVGEGTADRQLMHYQQAGRPDGPICRAGLWRYSRHPNYAFQVLGWVAIAVSAVTLGGGYPLGWWAIPAPVVMYWLLARVSGVPPLEAHMLRRHGDAYRAYQRETPAMFPRLARTTT